MDDLEEAIDKVMAGPEKKSRIISDEEKITEAAISSEADNAVRLMNIHQSKGLEFPYVFIPNLSRKPVSEQSIIRYDLKKGLSCKVPLPNDYYAI